MAISPKLKLGTGPDAESTCEWGQIEIDRIVEEANKKILKVAVKSHETLAKQSIASLKMFAEDLPDEATALWIELHTNPGEEPCNCYSSISVSNEQVSACPSPLFLGRMRGGYV